MTIHEANLFSANTDDFSSNGKKLLEKISVQLKKLKSSTYTIKGHSEGAAPKTHKTSKHLTAWEWTSLRAAKVTQFLDANGVEPGKLKAVGFSNTQPEPGLKPTDKKTARVEIVISF